jgi:hypothetical protein
MDGSNNDRCSKLTWLTFMSRTHRWWEKGVVALRPMYCVDELATWSSTTSVPPTSHALKKKSGNTL